MKFFLHVSLLSAAGLHYRLCVRSFNVDTVGTSWRVFIEVKIYCAYQKMVITRNCLNALEQKFVTLNFVKREDSVFELRSCNGCLYVMCAHQCAVRI